MHVQKKVTAAKGPNRCRFYLYFFPTHASSHFPCSHFSFSCWKLEIYHEMYHIYIEIFCPKLHISPEIFLQKLLPKQNKKKKTWVGPFMWTVSTCISRRRKIPLFSVWNGFLTNSGSLRVEEEQRPTLWSFCCVWVVEHLPLKATLSHILTVPGKQINNHAVFPTMELIFITPLTFANCYVCQVLSLDALPRVWLRWDMFVHSCRHGNAAKINHGMPLWLCTLYHRNLLVPSISIHLCF